MHVLFVAENLDRPETHLLRGLAARGVTVRLLVPDAEDTASRFAPDPVEVRPCPLRGRIDLDAIRTIRRTIRETGPDLVHCLRSNRPVANTLLAVRGLHTPVVCYRGTLGNLARWDPGSRLTYLSRRLTRIVCVSNAVRRYLLSVGVPQERAVTVYKGHDPDWYRFDPPPLDAFGIPAGALVVGCAANMRPLKGADILIQAMEHVSCPRPVHLLLIGEVRDPRIHELCARDPFRGRVHLAGFRTDAAALSGVCDLFVMPTLRREGLPRAVIEAMSQSVPPIVTDVGGMPELVLHDQCGLVVPPGDAQALGDAISSLATDDTRRARFASAARHRIETEFHVSTTVERTRALYDDVCSTPTHTARPADSPG